MWQTPGARRESASGDSRVAQVHGPALNLTAAERVALERMREECPEVLAGLSEWLADIVDDLVRTSQGRVVNTAQADDLLVRLKDELVGRLMATMEPWGEDEGLREFVVELLARHAVAAAKEGFVRRVIIPAHN